MPPPADLRAVFVRAECSAVQKLGLARRLFGWGDRNDPESRKVDCDRSFLLWDVEYGDRSTERSRSVVESSLGRSAALIAERLDASGSL
jgi:hypothetical protein